MQLGLTFPLQRKLKIKSVPYGAPLDRKYCWDLHCISLRGQDALLLVHCASRYTIVACGLTKFDWEHLTEFAMEHIQLGLLDAGMKDAFVETYLQKAGSIEYTRTHGRREVAFLNRAWEDVMELDFTVDTTTVRQPLLEQAVNGISCHCTAFHDRATAREFLYRIFPPT